MIRGEKFAAIRAKSEANGCSITVDFREQGFYFSYTQCRIYVPFSEKAEDEAFT